MRDYIGIGLSDDIKESVEQATDGLMHPKVIFVFAEYSKFEESICLMQEKYPNIPIVGTTGYCFANKNIIRNNIVIWAINEGIDVEVGVLENISKFPIKDIKSLEENIGKINAGNDNTVCIEFCTGAEEKIVSTINSAISKKNIPLIGGTSQGANDKGIKCVSLNGKVYSDTCVYALIKNLNGKIKTYSENIYKEKSGNFIATKVDVPNRRILELNGKKAGQVYCETLGITKNQINDCVLTNPLARVIGKEDFVIAIKLVDDEDALNCYKRVNQNDVLNILELQNYKEAIQNTLDRIKADFANISFIFSIDCIYRFLLFETMNFTKEYSNIMGSIGQHIGIVGEGEQYINQHVNQTMICVVFE